MSDVELTYWAAHFRRRPPAWRQQAILHGQLTQLLCRLTGNEPPELSELLAWTEYDRG